MAVLIDTNVLLRTLQPHHPHCSIAERAITHLRTYDEALCVGVQNIVELWAVATRPQTENGLGMTTSAAVKEVAAIKQFFLLLPEGRPEFPTWEKLVSTYGVAGKNVHDTRLVATMIAHGVDQILTFNIQDFSRYAEIRTIYPQSL